jgi:hypothetical protein
MTLTWVNSGKGVSSNTLSQNDVVLNSLDGVYTKMCYFLFHICIWSSLDNVPNCSVQEKLVFYKHRVLKLTLVIHV